MWKFVPVLKPKNEEEEKYETDENGANDRAAAAVASSSTSSTTDPANDNAKNYLGTAHGKSARQKGYPHKFIRWNVSLSFFGARNGDDDGSDGVTEHTTPLEFQFQPIKR